MVQSRRPMRRRWTRTSRRLARSAQEALRELDEARQAGVSEAVIRGLVASGTLLPEIVSLGIGPAAPDPDFAPPRLEAAQADIFYDPAQIAVARLRDTIEGAGFDVT